MKLPALLTICFAAAASAAPKPVAFRLASLPATLEPGQEAVLCAANIGTGAVDVTLEFINVATGAPAAEKTVTLEPLGHGAGSSPCVTLDSGKTASASPAPAMSSSFVANQPRGAPMVVGVAMVRKAWYSFREAQVTASIQVQAHGPDGSVRTVETIPLSRTTHPADGAPVYAPPADSGAAHHK